MGVLVDDLVYEGEYFRYAPAISEFSSIPIDKEDFVNNTDVLEYIPEKDPPDVVSNLSELSDKVFFNIATGYANEILPDGQNVHCTVWLSGKRHIFVKKYFLCSEIVYSAEKKGMHNYHLGFLWS